MNNSITKENMLFTLPLVLQGDKSTGALAEATAEVLANRLEEIDRLRIISNIDNLEEALLAILARDFKVDWWDPDYSLEEKRRTVKDSWRVHKTLGTKAAVETAISAIYPNTRVLEWFQYGGEPYHFQLLINISDDDVDSERMRRVLNRLNFYKSLRSHNDGIHYFMEPETMTVHVWTGCPGLNEKMKTAVNVPELTPLGGEAEARVGTVEYGENTVMAASLKLHTEVLGGSGGVQVGAAAKGIKVCLTTELDARRDWPDAEAHTGASAGSCGWSMGMEAVMDLRKAEYPGGTFAHRAAGTTAGIYQKFITEVSANETLE